MRCDCFARKHVDAVAHVSDDGGRVVDALVPPTWDAATQDACSITELPLRASCASTASSPATGVSCTVRAPDVVTVHEAGERDERCVPCIPPARSEVRPGCGCCWCSWRRAACAATVARPLNSDACDGDAAAENGDVIASGEVTGGGPGGGCGAAPNLVHDGLCLMRYTLHEGAAAGAAVGGSSFLLEASMSKCVGLFVCGVCVCTLVFRRSRLRHA